MKKITRLDLPTAIVKGLLNVHYFVELEFTRDDLLDGIDGVFAEAVGIAKNVLPEDEAKACINYGQMGAVFFFFQNLKQAEVFFYKHNELFNENREYFNWTLSDRDGQIHSNT